MMDHRFSKLLFFVALAVGIVLPVAVVAAQGTSVDSALLMSRVETNTQQYPFELSEEAKQSLASRCTEIQEKLRIQRNTINAGEDSRNGVYRRIESRLSVLQKRFDAQSLDTSIIDLLLANYRKDLALYTNAVTQREVVLSDSMAMDCAGNPSAFRSQIEAIRVSHQKTIDEVVRINNYLNNEVPLNLDKLKDKLN